MRAAWRTLVACATSERSAHRSMARQISAPSQQCPSMHSRIIADVLLHISHVAPYLQGRTCSQAGGILGLDLQACVCSNSPVRIQSRGVRGRAAIRPATARAETALARKLALKASTQRGSTCDEHRQRAQRRAAAHLGPSDRAMRRRQQQGRCRGWRDLHGRWCGHA